MIKGVDEAESSVRFRGSTTRHGGAARAFSETWTLHPEFPHRPPLKAFIVRDTEEPAMPTAL